MLDPMKLSRLFDLGTNTSFTCSLNNLLSFIYSSYVTEIIISNDLLGIFIIFNIFISLWHIFNLYKIYKFIEILNNIFI